MATLRLDAGVASLEARTPMATPEPSALTPADPSTPPAHDPYLALRSKDYRRFALGFAPSSIGLQMMNMAVGWEVYERTHDAMFLAYIGLARALPVLLLTLPAGHVADIFNRRTILVITQASFALAAAGMAAASYLAAPIWVFYILLFISGAARSFNGPARSSLLPMIVPPGAFPNAVTWNSGLFQTAAILGPILAGALIREPAKWLHHQDPVAWPVYLVTAVGCGIFAFSASGVNIVAPPRRDGRGGLTFASMVAGMSHVRKEKTILAALTLDLFAVLLGGATAMMPIYAKDILHVHEEVLGVLRAAPFVGALLMSLALAHRRPFSKAGPALLWSVAGFGACMIVFGISKVLWLSLAALFLSGALDTISVVIRHVLVQTRTPDEVRGRVSAVNTVFIESSNQLGEFESGTVARIAGQAAGSTVFGAVFSVVSGGIGTILVVAGIAALWPEMRRLRRI